MEPLSQQSSVVLSACQMGAGEAAVAFSQLLGVAVSLTVGTPSKLQAAVLPISLQGSGLAAFLAIGDKGLLVLLAASSGLVPSWCDHPNEAAQKELNSFAQKLGAAWFPDMAVIEHCRVQHLPQLVKAISEQLPETFSALPIQLATSGESPAEAWVLWPAARPVQTAAADGVGAGAGSDLSPPQAKPVRPSRPAAPTLHRRLTENDLPAYARSLLRIRVPVVVTLARKPQPLSRILELGPGAILHFSKSCEEPLDLEVGGRNIAAGEAVKVGDKFGLRITSILLPEERFQRVPSAPPSLK